MSEPLHRLTYYSRNNLTVSPEAMTRAIEQILDAARRNNARLGITGALMFNSGCFAQVLEGPPGAIERTFERIQRDPRHRDVSVLEFIPIERRTFDAWSMGYVGRLPGQAESYANVATRSGFEPSLMSGETLFEALRQLVADEETAPA